MFRAERSRARWNALGVDGLSGLAWHRSFWLLLAAVLGLSDGRLGRRAALRGLVAMMGPAFLSRGARNAGERPAYRAVAPEAATAFAFAVGSAQEHPAAGAVLLPLAASVVAARTKVGRRPVAVSEALTGAALGVAFGLATRRLWPVAPRRPAEVRRVWSVVSAEPMPEGEGMVLIVNPSSGPAWSSDPTDALREGLPRAEIVRLDEDTTLEKALAGVEGARALGVAGGDGTVNAVAEAALRHNLPLLVVPSGTLNHFARDLGVESVEESIESVRSGELVAVDVGVIDGSPFLNTASFGSYAALVDARESLEERIGKWPAMLIALVRVLWRGQPVRAEIDGRRVKVWMIFIGNCRYQPEGLAPGWREQLDDGLLDVRLVDGSSPFSRTRLLLAVLAGRLARCPVYHRAVVTSLRVHSQEGPLRLARDGETFDGGTDVIVRKHPTRLRVFRPSTE
jgi:undecaprenyl-diphosphatase